MNTKCAQGQPQIARSVAVSFLLGLALAAQVFAQPDVPPPPGPAVADEPAAAPADPEGLETLTRGPIHEAFANPAELDPAAAPTVSKQPPADVPEQPPEYKPEGDYLWIPGYWSWDDDRNDFLWVTGVWRQPPPGKRWVPGYWHQVDGGWQRVQGFWADDAVQEVTYYEQPPATLEAGPSSPAPADNYFWVPGNWAYASTGANPGFNWQAGYWAPYQQNWVYVPARWVWSPAGYVFVPGYWDYRLSNRGQIFAPVYFQTALYTQPGWFYQPQVVIPTNNLFIYLWLRPRFGGYYFGNYFGAQYAGLGFVPWVNISIYSRNRYFYDPFYSYARVHYHRQNVDFLGRVQGWHNYYAQNPNHRPPGTWREQQRFAASHPAAAATATTNLIAQPIQVAARQTNGPLHLAKIDERTRQAEIRQAQQIKHVDQERRRLEQQHAVARIAPPTSSDAARVGEGAKGGDRAKAGETSAQGKAVAKLTLPKADRPIAAASARPSSGDPKTATASTAPPPLPNVARSNIAAQDRGGKAGGGPRPNALPDNARGGERSTFAPKTGQAAKTSGRPDDPRTLPRQPGTGAITELPPANSLPQARTGPSSGNPGALPRRTGDAPTPRVGAGGQGVQDHELPQVQPPGPAGDLPRVGTPSRPNDVPRTAKPGPRGDQATFGARGQGSGPQGGGQQGGGQQGGGPKGGGQPRAGGQQGSGAKGKARSGDKG